MQRFGNGLAVDNARCFTLQWHLKRFALNGPHAVDGLAQGVDNPTQNAIAHVDVRDLISPFYGITFFNFRIVAEQYSAYVIFFQVQGQGLQAIVESEQFTRLHFREAVNTRYTVADLQYRPYFFEFGFCLHTG